MPYLAANVSMRWGTSGAYLAANVSMRWSTSGAYTAANFTISWSVLVQHSQAEVAELPVVDRGGGRW